MSVWKWLKSTRELQERVYGVDYTELKENGDALADYLTWNHSAAVVELSEAMQEVDWKPWSKPRGWVSRAAFIGELIDAAHFIGNMATAVGCTDEEWEVHYREKQQVNRERQAVGYNSRASKCRQCGRALDDRDVACSPAENYCQLYGAASRT